jgi:hypothetical protein
MPDRKLKTVAERPTWTRATVIDCRPGFSGPYFQGEGPENCVCGNCGTVLVSGMVVAMLSLYLCCPECGTYNLAEGEDAVATA